MIGLSFHTGILAIEEGAEGDFSSPYNYFGFYTKTDFILLGKNIGLSERMVEKQINGLKDKVFKALSDGFRTEIPDKL